MLTSCSSLKKKDCDCPDFKMHKKRKTRRTRKEGGMRGVQLFGGYKENMIALLGGGNRPILAVSDYPPGFKKFTNRDKRQWNKMKAQHKKKHRKK